ncbi:hypothetical protein NIES2104_60870 [Leptolyngbya sp. NIES-2104]|nr:hypothetical protein NIES2104_60870 [Leptolyngbya sp. NIES-2104]
MNPKANQTLHLLKEKLKNARNLPNKRQEVEKKLEVQIIFPTS